METFVSADLTFQRVPLRPRLDEHVDAPCDEGQRKPHGNKDPEVRRDDQPPGGFIEDEQVHAEECLRCVSLATIQPQITDCDEASRQIHCRHKRDNLDGCAIINGVLRQLIQALGQVSELFLHFGRLELVAQRQRIPDLISVNMGLSTVSTDASRNSPSRSDSAPSLSKHQRLL